MENETGMTNGWDHRAFVAGATGYIGRMVVELLLENCVETVAHIRPDQSQIDDWVNHFHSMGATVDLTAWKQVEMSNTLARIRPTMTFALLGSHKSRMRTKRNRRPNPFVDSYEAVDYGLNVMLARASASSGSNPRFVFISTAAAKEKSGKEFNKTRFRTEEFIKKTGLPYTIVRAPSIRNGGRTDYRKKNNEAKLMLNDGFSALVGIFGASQYRLNHSSISNLQIAESIVDSAFNKETINKILMPKDYRKRV